MVEGRPCARQDVNIFSPTVSIPLCWHAETKKMAVSATFNTSRVLNRCPCDVTTTENRCLSLGMLKKERKVTFITLNRRFNMLIRNSATDKGQGQFHWLHSNSYIVFRPATHLKRRWNWCHTCQLAYILTCCSLHVEVPYHTLLFISSSVWISLSLLYTLSFNYFTSKIRQTLIWLRKMP